MRMYKYGRELDLLLLLTDNANHTVQDLADRLDVTRRTIYYYLEYFRDSGFEVVRSGNYYRLDRTSAFFKRLHENIALTTDEARYLHQLLGATEKNDYVAHNVRAKLERQFRLEDLSNPELQQRVDRNIRTLKQAMTEKKIVVLRGYSSPHSHTVADRYVEPFLLMNNGLDLRCHEIKTHTNKTYRLARMAEVEILDIEWLNEDKHKAVYTDLFMFSGEERMAVELRMGQLAHNLMLEEYPDSEACFTSADEGHWVFKTEVVSYLGITRFVLGLYEDIEVLGDEAFRRHMREQVERLSACQASQGG
ncbi:MAG: WYL domain-containing transcriptional regulator [Prevotella sp.]|nr:WYL domain-containing transcriptional regulator [Prevotella sp.]